MPCAAGVNVSETVVSEDANSALFANALLFGNALYEANSSRLITLGVPGPPAFLQPRWPNFMSDLPTREKVNYCILLLLLDAIYS